MTAAPTIWLASRSPRRRQLLRDAGIDAKVLPANFDDGTLTRPSALTPRAWVVLLAFIKAGQVKHQLESSKSLTRGDVILAADTMCIVDDEPLGQPRDAADARRMVRLMRGRTHETITGVCLLTPKPFACEMMVDVATVHVGALTDKQIEQYVNSGDWRGKAGAYNLAERIDAGWPIECDGDPTTVMGLPMRRLMPLLRAIASSPVTAAPQHS